MKTTNIIRPCFGLDRLAIVFAIAAFHMTGLSTLNAQQVIEFKHTSGVHDWKNVATWDPEDQPNSFTERVEINDGTSNAKLVLTAPRDIDSFLVKGSAAPLYIVGTTTSSVGRITFENASENRNLIILGEDEDGGSSNRGPGQIRTRAGIGPIFTNNGTIRGDGEIRIGFQPSAAQYSGSLRNNTGIGTGNDIGIKAEHGTLTIAANVVNSETGLLSTASGGTLRFESSWIRDGEIQSGSATGPVQYFDSRVRDAFLSAGTSAVTGDHQVRSDTEFQDITLDATMRVLAGAQATFDGINRIDRSTSAQRKLELLSGSELFLDGSTVQGTGSIDVANGARLFGHGSIDVPVSNAGIIEAVGSSLFVTESINGGILHSTSEIAYTGASIANATLSGFDHNVEGDSGFTNVFILHDVNVRSGVLTLDGVTNSLVGSIDISLATAELQSSLVNFGTVTVQGDGSITSGGVSGLSINNSGVFEIHGNVDLIDGTIENLAGGLFAGTGTVDAILEVNSGSTVAPGNSPGTLTVGETTLDGGGIFQLEVSDFEGSAGFDPGWDLLVVNGTLEIIATPSNPFVIDLDSLLLTGAAGDAANFSLAQVYTLPFITATDGITGYDPEAFVVDSSDFTNPFVHPFKIVQVGNSLALRAVPEPSSAAFLILALSAAVVRFRSRAKSFAAGQ